MTWLDGPLAGLDLETTGVNTEKARIVTACVGFAPRPGTWDPADWLLNPGIRIPKEAAEIHGITTEHAAMFGIDPKDAVGEIAAALQAAWALGAPVIGHNVIYDLTLLDREMRRHLGRELIIGGPVIDTLVLDKQLDRFRKGSRKLSDTCAHHGIPLGRAHSADADCFAAVRLAWVMLSSSDYGTGTLAELHDLQVGWYAEQRASFFDYLRRQGKQPDDLNTVWPLAPVPEREVAA